MRGFHYLSGHIITELTGKKAMFGYNLRICCTRSGTIKCSAWY